MTVALFHTAKHKVRSLIIPIDMAQLRDLSPIAGAINWAKQIERQLNMYMKRVEDVLGKGWELYAEGAKLASESNSFRRKLDTRPIYEAWLHEINRRDLQISGRLFDVQKTRAPVSYTDKRLVNGHSDAEVDDGFVYSLAINFDPQIITLFKEVRNLLWLGFSVPHAISNIAKDAKRVYPHAVSLVSVQIDLDLPVVPDAYLLVRFRWKQFAHISKLL